MNRFTVKQFLREQRQYLLIYFSISLIHVILWRFAIYKPNVENIFRFHSDMISWDSAYYSQYRVAIYLLAEGMIKYLHFPLFFAYAAINFWSMFLCLAGFHYYFRHWFDEKTTLIGVLFIASVYPLIYDMFSLNVTDLPNLFIYIVGFIIILKGKDRWLFFILPVAMFVRETIGMIVFVYLANRVKTLGFRRAFFNFAMLSLVALTPYVGLRFLLGYKPMLGTDLMHNLTYYGTYLRISLFFNIFLFLAFKDWRRKPEFLRNAAVLIPPFLLPQFFIGNISEIRLLLPLMLVIVPLGLCSWPQRKGSYDTS